MNGPNDPTNPGVGAQPPNSSNLSSGAPVENPWDDGQTPAGGQGDGQQQPPPASGTPEAGQQPPPAPAAPPPLVGLSKEQLAEIVQSSVKAVQPQQQQQYTQEDFDRAFNVVKVTPEVLAKFGLPATPEAAVAFGELTQAIVRQAVTMASYQVENTKRQLLEQFSQEYGPARQFAIEQQEQRLKEEFFTSHPDLKGYDPLLVQVKDQLLREGQDFKGDKQAVFKAVADRTRAIIKSLPGLNGQNQQQQPQNGSPRPTGKMSTVSAGGQGGAGAGGGSASGANTAKSVFG